MGAWGIGRIGQTEFTCAGLDQGKQFVAVLKGGELDPNTAVVEPELSHHAGHGIGGQRRQAGQGERPRQQSRDRGHCGASGLEVADDLPCRFDKGRPSCGEPNPVADPSEELGTNLGFEVLDRQRQGGLGDEDGLGGCRESSMIDHSHEVAEFAAIHLLSLSIDSEFSM